MFLFEALSLPSPSSDFSPVANILPFIADVLSFIASLSLREGNSSSSLSASSSEWSLSLLRVPPPVETLACGDGSHLTIHFMPISTWFNCECLLIAICKGFSERKYYNRKVRYLYMYVCIYAHVQNLCRHTQ